MVCDICRNVKLWEPNETGTDNLVVTCMKCDVKVHQLCYGVSEYTDEWLCDFCESSVDSLQKVCVLCPEATGALKRVANKETWVHVICGLVYSKCEIINGDTMGPIDISGITKHFYRQKCNTCVEDGLEGRYTGAVVKCVTNCCKRYVHVTCALKSKALFEKVVNGRLTFLLACDHHLRDVDLSISSEISFKRTRTKTLKRKAHKKNASWITGTDNGTEVRVKFRVLIEQLKLIDFFFIVFGGPFK